MRRHSSRFSARKARSKLLFPFFVLLLCAGGAAWYLFFENELPQATIEIDTPYFGKNTVFAIQAQDKKSGIKKVRVTAVQGQEQRVFYQKENPRTGYRSPVGPMEETAKIAIDSKQLGLSEGPLQLVLEVTDFSLRHWLRGNRTVVRKEILVDTQAPKIHILHTTRSLSPGGTGIAIYRTDDAEAVTGVQLNGHFNRAYPVVPGNGNICIAYFGVPYDSRNLAEMTISAKDAAGNTTIVPIKSHLRTGSDKRDTIDIGDGFLNWKVPEFQQYYPELSGDMIERYLYINTKIRRENAETIAGICQNTSADKLWEGGFGRMAGSKRAGFADYRSYHYKGKVIDHQVHLGIDIASIQRADVKAANNGIVVYADYLGIYGNMVIIDHGQGVFSLYSHMSQINVSTGSKVAKGDILGLTGTTGMAGGDHLHFSMLIHGIFVTPKEWWDKKWVQLHIEDPIQNLRLHRADAR